MRWFSPALETDEPDITGLRHDPGRAPGLSPGRVFLLVLFLGGLLGAWLVMPLSSWVSGWWGGFGRTPEPVPQMATPPQDEKALNTLMNHHLPKPPPAAPVVAASPVPTPMNLSMYDDLKSQYDWLAQQYADLLAWKNGQSDKVAEPLRPKSAVAPSTKQEDDTAKKRAEEAKKKREAFGKSEPIFLTRKKDEKVGQLHALKSPYSLAPSEVIPCETTMEISSDTPGAFVAIVAKDVPDTVTRTQNVIPKGSKFVLRPRGKLIYGDSRMDIQTQTLTFPGGSWLKMPTNTVTDRAGTAGFTGQIDRHTLRIFGSILLTGVLRGGTTIATGGYGGGVGERVGGAVVQEGAAEGTRQARQFMRTDPTLTIPNQYTCSILLEEELVLTRSFGRMP